MSLIGVRGTFSVASVTPDDLDVLMPSIAARMASVGATRIEREGSRLSFRSGFFLFSWSVLAPVGWASIEIEPGNPGIVRYDFSVTLMFLATCLGWLFWASSIVSTGLRDSASLYALGLATAVWTLVWVVAWARLHALARGSVDPAGWGASALRCPGCGEPYRPADYREGAPEWHCEACGATLPRSKAQ